jgi:hypothetical protein
MQKNQKKIEEIPKKPQHEDKRKAYTAPKLKVHGKLGHLTAGSGYKQVSS